MGKVLEKDSVLNDAKMKAYTKAHLPDIYGESYQVTTGKSGEVVVKKKAKKAK